jgi:hypothetical protein
MTEPKSRPVRPKSEPIVVSHWIALINRTEHEKQCTLNIKLVIFSEKNVSNGSIDVLSQDPSQYTNHEQESGSAITGPFPIRLKHGERCGGPDPTADRAALGWGRRQGGLNPTADRAALRRGGAAAGRRRGGWE